MSSLRRDTSKESEAIPVRASCVRAVLRVCMRGYLCVLWALVCQCLGTCLLHEVQRLDTASLSARAVLIDNGCFGSFVPTEKTQAVIACTKAT